MEGALLDVTLLVSSLFERLGIRYLIGGSVASTLWGENRNTHDADFVVDLRPEHVDRVVAGLKDAFYVDSESAREAVRARRMFNAIHVKSGFKIDVHVREYAGIHKSELDRALRVRIRSDPEGFAKVATPEDTLLQKLRWYRLGDEASDHQWRDVIGLMKINAATLDRAYMNEWAREIGVLDILTRALRESGIEDVETD